MFSYSNSRCELTAVHCDRIELDTKTFGVLNNTQYTQVVRRSHPFNPLQNAPQPR
ncbi:hypothetical protein [Nostoc sp.]|uniref:hypothetical protein n=1 Tax=Nostoc sp. TaxID=1180 RepID=UPI002FFC5C14